MGNLPKRLSTTYFHLKCLCCMHINFYYSKEIFATLCICRSLPHLQELKIRATYFHINEEEEVYSWFQDGEELDSLFNHLQFVEMHEIHGEMPELEFIRFLLANSPVLHTISIKYKTSGLDFHKSRFYENLMQFRRASAEVQIIYV